MHKAMYPPPPPRVPRPPAPRAPDRGLGLARKMTPPPECGAECCVGSGRLMGRKAHPTGGDSALAFAAASPSKVRAPVLLERGIPSRKPRVQVSPYEAV